MEEEPETPRALSWEDREAPEVKIEALRPGESSKGMNGGRKPERKGYRKSRLKHQCFRGSQPGVWIEFMLIFFGTGGKLHFPFSTTGSKKRKSQEPSSNLEDEEKGSLACTGMFKGGPLYFCLTCGRCYKKYINLFNHQFKAQKTTSHKTVSSKPQHRKERTFSCQLCNKIYRDPSGLSRHRRTHLGYRPSSCSVCGKRFRDQSEVKRHMKVHENRKPVTGNQEHEVKKVPLTTAGSQGPNVRHVKVIQGPVARAKASCSRASSMNVRSSSIPVRCSSNLHCLFCSIRFTKRICFLTYLKLHFKNEPDQYLGGGEPAHSSVVVGSQENTHRKQDIYCCPACDVCFREKESLLHHWCYKESGRPSKCWEFLGHSLGFLDDPFETAEVGVQTGLSY
ncbi:zinc finger protein 57 [Microtus ochrogaster]|uniref:Zinc finger protein 57 n=1 Tax=Microtus ochrogaster TaxID=79684 RepID=A0ABM1UGU5_MICOH|nr:zinc finger protein 57 [Microtus ochrogaster]